ncbi:DUF2066 domain-containing protein [Methylogaea oryzae]|uniref:DUF2066 domain-containing protein n=1 Tax=Methylogaea oryzae TaxID=1295382 RepID=A0A8D4VQK1_9GAMM|nr:DUF2066 domain-containing protein [Methylogaea oryzae]BBL71887.1 hypothetical protein MoryE10_24930 [Methylogaea oryzae]
MRVVTAVMGICLLAAAGWAGAGEVKNLYQGEVAVAGRDEAAAKAAMPGALRAVLGKLLHRDSLADAAWLKGLLGQAPQLAQSYGYAEEPAPAGGAPNLRLRVQFAPAAVNAALAAQHLAPWGAQRPDVLAWLSVKDGTASRLVLAGDGGLSSLAQKTAQERGVALLLPAADDAAASRLQDPSFGDDARVLAASSRYGSAAILAGQIVKQGEQAWQAQWRWWLGGEARRWNETYPTLADALRAGFGAAYDSLAPPVAAAAPGAAAAVNEAAGVVIRVEGLTGLAELAAARRQLEALAADKQAQWLDMDGDAARFRLKVTGGAAALEPLLGGAHWQRSGEPDGDALRYRWLP